MKKQTAAENQPAESDNVKLDLLNDLHAFLARQITITEGTDSRPPLTMPPPAPLGPRSRAIEIETSAEERPTPPPSQLDLEI